MSWNVIKLRRSAHVVSQATRVPVFNYTCSFESRFESEHAVTTLRGSGAYSAEFSKKLPS